MTDFRGQSIQCLEAFSESKEFGNFFCERQIRVLVGKICIDFRITVNQNSFLAEFDFRDFEVSQCHETSPSIFNNVIVIGVAYQGFQGDGLQQGFQTVCNAVLNRGSQMHIVGFVVSSVRDALNSIHLDFAVHDFDPSVV